MVMDDIQGFEIVEQLGESCEAETFTARPPLPDEALVRLTRIKPRFSLGQTRARIQNQLVSLETLPSNEQAVPSLHDHPGAVYVTQPLPPGEPLNRWLSDNSSPSLARVLKIGISLARSLAVRHGAGYVHQCVKPDNIFIQSEPFHVTLLDDIRIFDGDEISQFIDNPAYCIETLPYLSPEQTGKIRHSVTSSGDLYSLGCVLFHCLTGTPPFRSTDPSAVLHSHLAELPRAVTLLNAECPVALASIVATLLEKTTEKRYQTAEGLIADLEVCLQHLEAGTVGEPSLLGNDYGKEIRLPSPMVGRESQKQQLLDGYLRVCESNFGVAMIAGLSGIGKTRLVEELELPIVAQRGYFASGKYNQYTQHHPYSTLAQALGKLMRLILTEEATALQLWKSRMLSVLGGDGQLVIDVIPEVETITGPQPEVKPLPPKESRHRFNDLMSQFIGCLATSGHPLVLFIDDLQWCDTATFDLLENIFNEPDGYPCLFIIGAYRQNEITKRHRLHQLLALLNNSPETLLQLQLEPLDQASTNQMTALALSTDPRHTVELTETIYPAAGGNPLFVNESLRWLRDHDQLHFHNSGHWLWEGLDLSGITLPNTARQLFKDKLIQFPQNVQTILASAAMLGARFRLNDLAFVTQHPVEQLLAELREVLALRVLQRDNDTVSFFHDQLQAAAASLFSDAQQKQCHAQIAAVYIDQYNRAEGDDQHTRSASQVFAIAEHLAKGRLPGAGDDERFVEATFSYLAGNCAADSLAHETAEHFFIESEKLCSVERWRSNYQFMLDLHKRLARAALIAGHQKQAEAVIKTALQFAQNDFDKAQCLYEQTSAVSSLGDLGQSLVLTYQCSEVLGHPLPKLEADIVAELTATAKTLVRQSGKIVSALRLGPELSDPRALLELDLHSEALASAFISGQTNLYFLIAARGVKLSIAYGLHSSVCFSLSALSFYFLSRGEYQAAQNYDELMMEVALEHPTKFGCVRAITNSLWFIQHHTGSMGGVQSLCEQSITNGRNAGELNYSGLSCAPLVWFHVAQGNDFAKLRQQLSESIEFCQRYSVSQPLGICVAVQFALLASIDASGSVANKNQRESQLAEWREVQHSAALASYYCVKAIFEYFRGNAEQGEHDLITAEPYLDGIFGTILHRLWSVFRYLCGLQMDRSDYQLTELYDQVSAWAEHGTILRPYLALMRAEASAQQLDVNQVRSTYWEAIDTAHQQDYTFVEAFLHSRLAGWLEKQGYSGGRMHQGEAVSLYQVCHAQSFAAPLVKQLTRGIPIQVSGSAAPTPRPDKALDSQFLMQASQAIMEEQDFDSLLLKILSSAMERLGAKTGYLLLLDNDELTVHVAGEKHAGLITKRLVQSTDSASHLCIEVARYVVRSKIPLTLGNAEIDGDFTQTKAVLRDHLKSILCVPLVIQQRCLGALYLENSLIPSVFQAEDVALITLLTAQAAIALDNNRLIAGLRETQQRLTAREQNLSITLNSIGDGVIVTDPVGRVERLNSIAEHLTGTPIAVAKGQPLGSIFSIADATTGELLPDLVKKVLTNGETVYLSNQHSTLVSQDGSEYQITNSAAPIRDSDGETLGMVVVFHDETESYRLRKAAAQSHERLEQVMADMTSMVATLTPQGVVTLCNNRALTLVGMSHDQILGKTIWDSSWWKHDEAVLTLVWQDCQQAALGVEIQHDLQLKTVEGTIWIELSIHPVTDSEGEVVLLVAEGRDISTRKIAEQSLLAQQQQEERVMNSLAEGVLTFNEQGLVVSSNKSARTLFDYSAEEFVGKNVSELVLESAREEVERDLESLLKLEVTANSTTLFEQEVVAKRKNGDIFPLLFSVVELPLTVGGSRQFVGSGQDLTERNQRENIIKQSQKMDALGKLTGGIAHDYNNMLGVVLGYSELLERLVRDKNSQQSNYLQKIKRAGERGSALTKKLLAYSRQKPHTTKIVDINKILLDQQDMLEKPLTSRIRLVLDLCEQPVLVQVDVGDLEDVILNLCINAMHAIETNGNVTIATRVVQAENKLPKMLPAIAGETLLLSITDTGVGMAPEIQEHVFEPFFSTKGEHGTGLGLSQVYGFMERSGGQIDLKSEPDQGTCFSLYFPTHTRPIDQLESSAPSLNKLDHYSENILIVDDEPDLLDLYRIQLEERGYTVFTANGAVKAKKILGQQTIAVMISDVIMPVTNGYALAAWVQTHYPEVSIQLVSGFDDAHDLAVVDQQLRARQLVKPVSSTDLLRRIGELIEAKY